MQSAVQPVSEMKRLIKQYIHFNFSYYTHTHTHLPHSHFSENYQKEEEEETEHESLILFSCKEQPESDHLSNPFQIATHATEFNG